MSNATPARRDGVLWYPVLLPLWPLGVLYAANAREVPWPEVLRPALVVAAAAVLLYLLARRVLGDRHRAGVAVVWWWLWFLGWGHIEHALSRWPAMLQQYLFSVVALWVLALGAGLALVILTRRSLAPLGRPLNAVALLALAWQVAAVASSASRAPAQAHETPPPASRQASAAAGLPSIYYIVPDSYGRQDVLQHLYGYDNEPFLRFLESRGFYVARQAQSNYCHTSLSQASTLRCQYLKDARQGRDATEPLPGDLVLTNYLQQRGYRVALRSFNLNRADLPPDDVLPPPLLSNFEQKLLAMTMLPAVKPPAIDPHAATTLALVRCLGEDVGSESQPLFLRVHMLCPHPPFVLPPVIGQKPRYIPNAESEDGDRMGGSIRDYVRGYRAQLVYLNDQLMPAIDRLLAKAGPNSIVILQGDHGPGSQVRWEKPERTLMRERFSILLAVRLPPGPRPALRQDLTPINLFPLLLNHYLGCTLAPRPDESYFSRFSRQHEFMRVTDAVRADGWRLGYPGHWGPEVPPAR